MTLSPEHQAQASLNLRHTDPSNASLFDEIDMLSAVVAKFT
jgi:hypothetical protein